MDIGLIPESQNGFMPGRSTIDPCFSLRLLQEKCKLHGQDLHLLFIDLSKAFDTVSRPGGAVTKLNFRDGWTFDTLKYN